MLNNKRLICYNISLLDIYTDSDFINIPAKGWKCSHLGCFNLKTFLLIVTIQLRI